MNAEEYIARHDLTPQVRQDVKNLVAAESKGGLVLNRQRAHKLGSRGMTSSRILPHEKRDHGIYFPSQLAKDVVAALKAADK